MFTSQPIIERTIKKGTPMSHYSIYELIGKFVVSKLPERYGGKKIQGVVENVYRDSIANKLEIKFKRGKKFYFREPQKIMYENEQIVLIYPNDDKVTDEDIFSNHKEQGFKGKGMESELSELSDEECRVVFQIQEKPKEYRRRRRRKSS